jgi:hypothetical protein
MALAEFFAEKQHIVLDEGKPLVDILTFAESSTFLNLNLFPVQRFILKLLFNIPLDSNLVKHIVLWDKFKEKVEWVFTSEVEFKQFLYDKGMLNSLEFKYPIIECYLLMGRRGSKTTITSIIAAYILYLILSKYNPQEYFGIIEDSEISIVVASNTKENAGKQYREIRRMVYRCPFFKPFLTRESVDKVGQTMWLRTSKVLATGDGGLLVVYVNAVSPSVRGGNNVLVIADEYAHYLDSEKSTKDKPLDRLFYDAAMPSLSGFRTPEGEAFGRSYFITSPNGKRGRVWEVVSTGHDSSDKLVLNMPAWWANELLSERYLRQMWRESEISFRQEYGAEILSVSASTWVKRSEFFINSTCENLRAREFNLGHSLSKRYAALDLGLSNDGSAIAVCHHEDEYKRNNLVLDDHAMSTKNVIVFDFIDYEYPEKGNPVRISAVADKMVKVMNFYHLDAFWLDNWCNQMFKQYLEDIGGRDYMHLWGILRVVNTTQELNSDWARVFRSVLTEGRMAYPNDSLLLEQLSGLREKVSGLYVKVENVNGHDDIPNAMFKACYQCVMEDVKERSKPDIRRDPQELPNYGIKRWRATLEARMRKGNTVWNRRV